MSFMIFGYGYLGWVGVVRIIVGFYFRFWGFYGVGKSYRKRLVIKWFWFR